MNIKYCIPFYTEFEDTKPGWEQLKRCREHNFDRHPAQGPAQHRSLNHLISEGNHTKNQMLPRDKNGNPKYDSYLLSDSDISFSLHNVLQLIKHDKDIVAGVYRTHSNQGIYHAGTLDARIPGKKVHNYSVITRGLCRVDWVGAGFMLIKRQVFENLDHPWFRFTMIEDGPLQVQTGHDIGFCIEAAKKYDIWADFDCEVGHRVRKRSDFNWD